MISTGRWALCALLAALALPAAEAVGPLPAVAAGTSTEQPALPGKLTRGEARDLVARLSDDQVRALLLGQLDKVAEADADGASGGAVEELQAAGDRARDGLLAMFASAGRMSEVFGAARGRLTADGATGIGAILLALLIAAVAGQIGERLFRRATGSIGQRAPGQAPPSYLARCGLLGVRVVIDLLSILIGLLVAVAVVFGVLRGNEAAPLVLSHLLGVVAAIRAVAAVSRAMLAPGAPELRSLPVSDAGARALHVRVIAFCALWTLSGFPADAMASLGADLAAVRLLGFIGSSVLICGLILMVLQARQPVAQSMCGPTPDGAPPEDRLRAAIASRWHVLAITYLLALWLLATATKLATGRDVSGAAIGSLLLFIALPVADAGLRALCARLFGPKPPAPAEKAAGDAGAPATEAPGGEAAASGAYQLAMLRNLRIFLALAVVMIFAGMWKLDLNALAAGAVGGRVANSLLDIVITLLLAYAAWSLVKATVERFAGSGKPDAEDDGGEMEIGGPGASRVATLLPLFKKVVMIALIVMVAMILLSSLGVNIGPLIAGAGVLGLAIGFGAQTLVKDVISGFFFLLDDAFRMGEYVEVDAIRGSVEHISVRSLQLRHHNGPVHTLPFGDIRHITNYSRDWAIMKFELRLPYDTDINKVRKIIKGVGQEMMDDETLGSGLLQPLKSQGVNRMDDSALIIRCKFTSKPGEQFVLRREAYTRIQQALTEAGIHFAPRRVIVETSGGEKPPPAVAQAAAGSLDAPEPERQQRA